jgi:ATP-dependent Clp protease ATP-binding subunit ClpA
MVKDIIVPLPERRIRECFLREHLSRFKLREILTPTEQDFANTVDMLDGLTLRDILQLVKLSHQCDPALDFEKLVNLYRFGETDSPWESLDHKKVERIQETLKQSVKGQDQAIEKVGRVIVRAKMGLSGIHVSRKRRAPKGVLFFVGPTGVGKTELAKGLARFLFGDEEACIRFDMSEFNHPEADRRLIGAPPGYSGYEDGGELTNAVKQRPFSVLLFDEIEKAHDRILDKFLQIMEDGRLTDSKGETVYFSETLIIFTSNIGAANVAVSKDPDVSAGEFKREVREHFLRRLKRPELLNRLGENIVPFNFITDEKILADIALTKLGLLKELLKDKYSIQDISFRDEDKALKCLAATVDKANGGRGLANEIVSRIIDPLAEFLFDTGEDMLPYVGRRVRIVQSGTTAEFGFELE